MGCFVCWSLAYNIAVDIIEFTGNMILINTGPLIFTP